MKFQSLLLALTCCVGFAMFQPACKSDPCDDTNCLNDGICVDGTCECPDGYSGPNCEIVDECHEANQNHEWGYDHAGGPDCWGAVCSLSDCNGSKQSPVNLTNATEESNLPLLEFTGNATKTSIKNNGHTIVFEQEPGSFITYGLTSNNLFDDYTLGQFHFHAKSEHELNGAQAALEAHFVCRSVWSDHYIVIGVMIEEGASNPFLAQFVNKLPATADQTVKDDALTYIPFDLLPSNKSYFTYEGSLTTPPCSEVVNWIVMENKVEATAAEIKAFADIMGHNYRPVQPLNSRTIKHVQQ